MILYVVLASKCMQEDYCIVGITSEFEIAVDIYNFVIDMSDYQDCEVKTYILNCRLSSNFTWLLDELKNSMSKVGIL